MAGRRQPYCGGTRGVAGVFRFEFQTAASAIPRRDAPESCNKRSPKEEGAGKAGCALHPRSRVQNALGKTHTSIQVQRRQSDLPCAVVLRLTSRSPATNSFCHRRLRIGICLSPVGPAHLRKLDISNGCQDHTTSPYAARLRQRHRWIVHPHRSLHQGGFSAVRLRAGSRLTSHRDSPCCSLCAPALPRPPHPLPTSVTIAIRPSSRAGMGRACTGDLPDGERGIFSTWDLTAFE
jgi:hypothetical protein